LIYVWAIGIYLLFLIFVSVRKGKNVKTQDDFMVAGRGVSALFLVGTLVCTWIGSGSLFGGAGRAYRQGFSALWMSAGAWLGLAIVYYLAPRVRKIAQYTVPDILETRYNAPSRLLGSIAIIIAYLTIASYQFIGGGRLLNILTGIDPRYGQLLVCALVVTYTIIAGMSSIVALDIFNGILITLGVLIAAPLALKGAGGWTELTATLPETHFTLFGASGWVACLGLFIPTFMLLLGESSIYQKFMSAKDAISARKAVIGMIVGVIVIESVLAATAVFGAGMYWGKAIYHTAEGGLDRAATETILLQLAADKLPVFAGILLLIGAAAIIFSTANTFLMVPSTNLTRDVYQRFINPDAGHEKIIRFQRIMIVVLALTALLVTTFFENILDMALYAYTMVGAAVTPALLAAFLWKRVTPLGGMISIAMGIVGTMVFAGMASLGFESLPIGFAHIPLEYDYIIYPAGFLSIVSLVVVSLLTPPSPEEKWRPFAADASD
jgi:SSS family solute:Na+ symporter/sodium/proline symporter